jgi:hypothetical protein
MARNDGRIEAGQKLAGAISARAWNRAQDAADRVLGVGTGITGGGATGADAASNIVLVRNISGVPVPMLGVLQIQTPAISPVGGTLTGDQAADSRAKQFASGSIVLNGAIPTGGSNPIAIATEPIAVNAIGRMAVGGCFACKVKLAGNHTFARGRKDDVTQLISTSCGPVRLLWVDNANWGDDKWAVGVM